MFDMPPVSDSLRVSSKRFTARIKQTWSKISTYRPGSAPTHRLSDTRGALVSYDIRAIVVYMKSVKSIVGMFLLAACFLAPSHLSAATAAEETRNFLAISPDNPFFPIIILATFIVAVISFFKPGFGLITMLFFMLISTDMQLERTTGERAPSIRVEDVILLVVSAGWLLNRAKTRTLSMFRRVPVNRPIMAMAAIILLASTVGYIQGTLPVKRGTLFTMKRLEYFWLFFMTLNIIDTNKKVKQAFKILLWLTVFISLVGAIQFYLYPLSGLVMGGATATTGFGRANTLADFYLIVVGIFLGLLIYSNGKKEIATYLLVTTLSAVAIIMTKSRGAYVSVPILFATLLLVSRSKKTLFYVLVASGIVTVYILFSIVVEYATPDVAQGANALTAKHTNDIDRQLTSIKDIAESGPEADSSFYARYSSWMNNKEEIARYPALGHGVGSVPLAWFDCQHVREMYETGLIGFAVFLYMNLAIFVAVLNFFFMTPDPFEKGVSCGFLGGHTAIMVHGVSLANFYTIMNMEVFWFVVALIMVLYHNRLKERQRNGAEESSVTPTIGGATSAVATLHPNTPGDGSNVRSGSKER